MNWLQTTLQTYPELAVFLALSLGFYIGNLKIGKFSLGVVTSVLLVGVLVGQLHIEISANVKSVFFLMFLFAVGYSVGPQFFSGLKSDGLPQVIFAVLQCVVSLLVGWLLAAAMGYNMGEAAGLIAGSQTISAVMGVATDTINQLNISPEAKKGFINNMPVCYAVTYIFGTAGSAWILSAIGPMLLGGLEKVQQQCKELEAKMGAGIGTAEPGMGSAINKVIFRAFQVKEDSIAVGKTVAEMEQYYLSIERRLFIERIRKGDQVLDISPEIRINVGDEIVLGGRRENMLDEEERIGYEVNDEALLDFEVETVSVLVTQKAIAGMTIEDIKKSEYSHGVVLKRLLRAGIEMPILPKTTFEKGDIAEIVGFKKDVERAIAKTGYADLPTEKTDMVFVGLGIVLGGFFGALAIHIGGVPISLSTSGGALIAGLIFGWLRSTHPTFGRIPEPALWMMNNVGLNTFIAVVGITAGPSFVAGFKQVGPMLFLIGIAATSIPLLIGVLMGRFIFKFHPALTLGCAAGARTTTAALSAIQDAVKSKTPALGYTVTYAVGNTLLIIWGVVIVLLMK